MSEANNNLSAENTNSSKQVTEQVTEKISPEQQSIPNLDREAEKEIDWHKLAHKLREHNRKLLKKVFQLEQEIQESNQALEEQTKRSRSNDLYAAKQAETINQYQEEIAELQQKMAGYQQAHNSQKAISESLTQKLEDSQQKITSLEQECGELKASNQLKNDELLEQKQQLQELNIRFQRQQQSLLEYKAKNPDTNVSQPIKAWSADPVEGINVKPKVPSPLKSPDWPAPAIAKRQSPINSIAAVQLPRFPRQAEGE